MRKMRIEATHDDTRFKVQIKGWWIWHSGYVTTDYFSMAYPTKEAAAKAIEGYINRFTYNRETMRVS